MPNSISYEILENGKYRLTADLTVELDCVSVTEILAFSIVFRSHSLRLLKGFEWDGPSGPAIDTPSAMRASAVHDALYTLMSADLLPKSYRKKADLMLFKLAREDGMGWFRASYFYYAVRVFGRRFVK